MMIRRERSEKKRIGFHVQFHWLLLRANNSRLCALKINVSTVQAKLSEIFRIFKVIHARFSTASLLSPLPSLLLLFLHCFYFKQKFSLFPAWIERKKTVLYCFHPNVRKNHTRETLKNNIHDLFLEWEKSMEIKRKKDNQKQKSESFLPVLFSLNIFFLFR